MHLHFYQKPPQDALMRNRKRHYVTPTALCMSACFVQPRQHKCFCVFTRNQCKKLHHCTCTFVCNCSWIEPFKFTHRCEACACTMINMLEGALRMRYTRHGGPNPLCAIGLLCISSIFSATNSIPSRFFSFLQCLQFWCTFTTLL